MVFKRFFHHTKTNDCGKLCCTKIEDFAVTMGDVEIFQKVNLHIHCGELTALIGPNGAGKSTLLKAILGEVPHTGKMKYVDAKGCHTGSPIIGYVPQFLQFDWSTPASVTDLFAACLSSRPVWIFSGAAQRQIALRCLGRVHADHLVDRRLGALSGGELQRVLLALALEPLPDLLLLDEPVSGVDQNGLALFYEIVSALRKQHDLAIILVSHDLQLMSKYADRVVLLNKTVVCSGSPQEVFSDARTKQIFGLAAEWREAF